MSKDYMTIILPPRAYKQFKSLQVKGQYSDPNELLAHVFGSYEFLVDTVREGGTIVAYDRDGVKICNVEPGPTKENKT